MRRAQAKFVSPACYMPAPDRQPLYLCPRETTHVKLDGPSLLIEVEGHAGRCVPLRRISRIIVNLHAEFTTGALLACADRSIAIIFLSGDGQTLARLLGRPGERQELRQRMVDLLSRPDWKDLYGNWRYAVQRQAIAGVRRRLRITEDIHARALMEKRIDRLAEQLGDQTTAANTKCWLREPAFAWMLNHCQQLGIGAQSELLHDGRPDLIGDLMGIFQWELEPIRIGWLRGRKEWLRRKGGQPRKVTRREMIRLYEGNSARLARAGCALTNRLHHWLVDLD